MSDTRQFDIILWGATGFTGQLVAKYFTSAYGADGARLRWGIAGRNKAKLEALRKELEAINPDAKELPILTGDSKDLASLKALAAQAKVICTTVGPFAKFGSELVAACVAEGAHYCDITGEVPWAKKMIETHHEEAKGKGLRIVPFSGYDSIPSDLGCLLVQQAMKEKHGVYCKEVKYITGPSKGAVSGGTLSTMMNMFEEAKKDKDIRRALGNPYALNPKDSPKGPDGKDQSSVRWDEDLQTWTAPFVMAGTNTRVVRRSNALLDFRYGEEFSYNESMGIGKGFGAWLKAQFTTIGLGVFVLLVLIKLTRKILLATVLPKPGEGPSEERQKSGFFTAMFVGKNEDKRIFGLVRGEKDPGYGGTAIMLGEAAVCLALDQEKLPTHFGIVTPATGMGEPLIDRLVAAGMTFQTGDSPIDPSGK